MTVELVRAAALYGERDVRIVELPMPHAEPDSAVLDVEICGVCGADYEMFERPVGGADFRPTVLGHEVVGRIREIGPVAARRWDVEAGSRVIVNEVIPCRHCLWCTNGNSELCNGFFGTDGRRYGNIALNHAPGAWGGFSTTLYLDPNSQVQPLADHVRAEAAAVFMPLANGVHWLTRLAEARPGETVVVIGPGAQGLAVAAVASTLSSVRLVVAGCASDTDRLEIAKGYGAIAVDVDALQGTVAELTSGAGADVIIIATSGTASVLKTATRIAAFNARIVVAGVNGWQSEEGFKSDALVFRALHLIGAPGHSWQAVRGAVRLLESDPLLVEPLIGTTFGLADIGLALDRTSQAGKGIHRAVRPADAGLIG